MTFLARMSPPPLPGWLRTGVFRGYIALQHVIKTGGKTWITQFVAADGITALFESFEVSQQRASHSAATMAQPALATSSARVCGTTECMQRALAQPALFFALSYIP